MNRDEHLKWAKERALDYLPGQPALAISSLLSDLRKHRELEEHPGLSLNPMRYTKRIDSEEISHWIEGFN